MWSGGRQIWAAAPALLALGCCGRTPADPHPRVPAATADAAPTVAAAPDAGEMAPPDAAPNAVVDCWDGSGPPDPPGARRPLCVPQSPSFSEPPSETTVVRARDDGAGGLRVWLHCGRVKVSDSKAAGWASERRAVLVDDAGHPIAETTVVLTGFVTVDATRLCEGRLAGRTTLPSRNAWLVHQRDVATFLRSGPP